MLAMFRDQPVFDPSSSGGSTASDGMPIGTVISYMGKTAPNGYLICDGAIYNISDYPDLSGLFKNQFGSANYFGGNGSTTFAVPDMRNLFLRGYHGSATALSGNIGAKQEATSHVYIRSDYVVEHGCGYFYGPGSPNRPSIAPKNTDTTDSKGYPSYGDFHEEGDSSMRGPARYTSRPVNMAVLYCIKAI